MISHEGRHMIFRYRFWVAAALFGAAAFSTSAQPAPSAAPAPPPGDLLLRMVQAHERLGPAAMNHIVATAVASRTLSQLYQVRRNSDSQYYAMQKMGDSQVHFYRDGGPLTIFTSGDSTYVVRDEFPFLPRYADDAIRVIGQALVAPTPAPAIEEARVDSIQLHGENVFRIAWPASVERLNLYNVPITAVIVGQNDGLLRRVSLSTGGGVLSHSITYQLRDEPFPAETFQFVPPAGVQATALPATETAPEVVDG
jgi:hypothetical protein